LQIDPTLAEAIAALSEAGYWAHAYDTRWRIVAETAEVGTGTSGPFVTTGRFVSDEFHFGPTMHLEGANWHGYVEVQAALLRHVGSWVLADLGVDLDGLREMLHPALRDIADELEPCDAVATAWPAPPSTRRGDEIEIGLTGVAQRVRDSTGHVVGTVVIVTPRVGMTTIMMLTARGDLNHLQRMHRLAGMRRRPTAVLFADLEGSAQLSKRMPTAAYFTLVRRIIRAADACVINEGGLVGRHVGDGVSAFFVAETTESESACARACIAAARALQASMRQIAEHHELPAADVSVRAGLHWGARLYIGSIITLGRAEVTALGDEVNEAARIEACATGGRLLASKDLIERLDEPDAAMLGIDPHQIRYTQLADLDTATEKARRDAPAIPVHDIATATR
jgi:class 3 adenylate cyclase